MNLLNLKITTRLTILTSFLITSTLVVGITGWQALNHSNARMSESAATASNTKHAVDVARRAQVSFKIQVQEWKNILLRGNDAGAFAKYKDAFVAQGKETLATLTELDQTLSRLGLSTALIGETRSSLEQLETKYLEALTKYDQANGESAHLVDQMVKGMDREPTKKIDEIVDFVNQSAKKLQQQSQDEAAQYHRFIVEILLAIISVAAVSGATLTFWIVRSIAQPLDKAVKIAETIAAGDLTLDIASTSKDETGQLLRALQHMNESLVNIVGRVRTGTVAIASGSSQIAAGNHDLSIRTEQQASSIEETASSMEELTSTVKQNTDNARHANQLAVSASAIAEKGGEVVSQVVSTMNAINASSQKIVDIISVIDGIAFQTNILALNAAVEAARAGEQGRGFAVVATEVRTLAQRSAAAAKEIKALIGDSVDKVGAGSKLVAEAGETMDEVVGSIRQVTSIMSEIMSASEEQNTEIHQMHQAVGHMDQSIQQNAALMEEASAAAHSLQDQAVKLAEMVDMFKLDARHTAQTSATATVQTQPGGDSASHFRPALTSAARAPQRSKLASARPAATEDWEEF